jgi:hypothetical protein
MAANTHVAWVLSCHYCDEALLESFEKHQNVQSIHSFVRAVHVFANFGHD